MNKMFLTRVNVFVESERKARGTKEKMNVKCEEWRKKLYENKS
jgi:hypothetical protein